MEKYIRLQNGDKLELMEFSLSNSYVFKFSKYDANKVSDFFGNGIINYADIIYDDGSVQSVRMDAKVKSITSKVEDVVSYKKRIVSSSYIETVSEIDADGNEVHREVFHPEAVETIEEKNATNVVYVVLEKPSVSEQLEIIKDAVGIKDPNNMTLDEFKKYHKGIIGEKCSKKIFEGLDIEIKGESKHFSFELFDQIDFHDLMFCAILGDFYLHLPWHSDGELCDVYTSGDILKIYTLLSSNKMYYTTYCNILNDIINNATDMNSVKNVTFGMDVPEEYREKLDAIISAKERIIASINEKIGNKNG